MVNAGLIVNETLLSKCGQTRWPEECVRDGTGTSGRAMADRRSGGGVSNRGQRDFPLVRSNLDSPFGDTTIIIDDMVDNNIWLVACGFKPL